MISPHMSCQVAPFLPSCARLSRWNHAAGKTRTCTFSCFQSTIKSLSNMQRDIVLEQFNLDDVTNLEGLYVEIQTSNHQTSR